MTKPGDPNYEAETPHPTGNPPSDVLEADGVGELQYANEQAGEAAGIPPFDDDADPENTDPDEEDDDELNVEVDPDDDEVND